MKWRRENVLCYPGAGKRLRGFDQKAVRFEFAFFSVDVRPVRGFLPACVQYTHVLNDQWSQQTGRLLSSSKLDTIQATRKISIPALSNIVQRRDGVENVEFRFFFFFFARDEVLEKSGEF